MTNQEQELSSEQATQEPEPSAARAIFDWVVVVAVALTIALLVRTFLVAHYKVDGRSMATTLATNDRVFVNKLLYRIASPDRGDVVVLHQTVHDRDLIKRVIAVGGETVEMTNCVVKVDGAVLQEPYLDPTIVPADNCGESVPFTTVPEGRVYVLGDNRAGSLDSRRLGPIAIDELVGRAFVVFWPSSNWRWL